MEFYGIILILISEVNSVNNIATGVFSEEASEGNNKQVQIVVPKTVMN